jgi:hypothetical protein
MPFSLSTSPKRHTDCCLAISRQLVEFIVSHVQPAHPSILSIGSGSGLLESIIQQSHPNVLVNGVEVMGLDGSSAVNKYLEPEDLFLVKGTWETYEKALDYGTWLFIYPRESRLIEKYITLLNSKANVHYILWAGPRVDWPEFEKSFNSDMLGVPNIGFGPSVGLMEYEMCATFKRINKLS